MSLAESRPRRQIKKPLTYWEQYVETDTWYKAELVRDIPEEEMHAALEDDNLDDDPDEEPLDEMDEDEDFLNNEEEDDDSDSESTSSSRSGESDGGSSSGSEGVSEPSDGEELVSDTELSDYEADSTVAAAVSLRIAQETAADGVSRSVTVTSKRISKPTSEAD